MNVAIYKELRRSLGIEKSPWRLIPAAILVLSFGSILVVSESVPANVSAAARSAMSVSLFSGALVGAFALLRPSLAYVEVMEPFRAFGLSLLRLQVVAGTAPLLSFDGVVSCGLFILVLRCRAVLAFEAPAPWYADAATGVLIVATVNVVKCVFLRVKRRVPELAAALLVAGVVAFFLVTSSPTVGPLLTDRTQTWRAAGRAGTLVALFVAWLGSVFVAGLPGNERPRWNLLDFSLTWTGTYWPMRELLYVTRNPLALFHVFSGAVFAWIPVLTPARFLAKIPAFELFVFVPCLYSGYVLVLNLWGYEAEEAGKYRFHPFPMGHVFRSKFHAALFLSVASLAYVITTLMVDTFHYQAYQPLRVVLTALTMSAGLTCIGLSTSRWPTPVTKTLRWTARTVGPGAKFLGATFGVLPAGLAFLLLGGRSHASGWPFYPVCAILLAVYVAGALLQLMRIQAMDDATLLRFFSLVHQPGPRS